MTQPQEIGDFESLSTSDSTIFEEYPQETVLAPFASNKWGAYGGASLAAIGGTATFLTSAFAMPLYWPAIGLCVTGTMASQSCSPLGVAYDHYKNLNKSELSVEVIRKLDQADKDYKLDLGTIRAGRNRQHRLQQSSSKSPIQDHDSSKVSHDHVDQSVNRLNQLPPPQLDAISMVCTKKLLPMELTSHYSCKARSYYYSLRDPVFIRGINQPISARQVVVMIDNNIKLRCGEFIIKERIIHPKDYSEKQNARVRLLGQCFLYLDKNEAEKFQESYAKLRREF
ncbi:hypothetical protein [Parashewanella spongiae]|uniref:hypothetical protein n=1 Tax=Parashewanella spongiae TaxID=342950 RepID=UPI0010597CC3|nr:hypothetical protein [Parashewanella spongiae]